jgi:hypothetical protein
MRRRPIVYASAPASEEARALGVAPLERMVEDAIVAGACRRHHAAGPRAWSVELRPGVVAKVQRAEHARDASSRMVGRGGRGDRVAAAV